MKRSYIIFLICFLCSFYTRGQGEPLLGEIKLFAGTYVPEDWALCDGSILSIQEYQALFAVIGPTYGGNGSSTFALPDLRNKIPIGIGTSGGETVNLGQSVGANYQTLTVNQIPSHNHSLKADSEDGDSSVPTNRYLANTKLLDTEYGSGTSIVDMNASSIGNTGGGESFDNRQSSLGLRYIICINGAFPARN